MIIFSTLKYSELAKGLAKESGATSGSIETKLFPDGERYFRVLNEISDQDVVFITGAGSDEETLATYDVVSSLAEVSLKSLTLVITYFGYSTMERACLQGEVITSKTRSKLFDSLPKSCKIAILDLHSEKVLEFFQNHKVISLSSLDYVAELIKKEIGLTNSVLGSPDEGRSKFIDSLSSILNLPTAYVYKNRISGDTVELKGIQADVKGKTVIIYDDMIRTGSTLIQAAKAYRAAGAVQVFAIATHGVFTPGSLEKIENCGHFSSIFISDSHSNSKSTKLFKKFSIVPVITKALESIL